MTAADIAFVHTNTLVYEELLKSGARHHSQQQLQMHTDKDDLIGQLLAAFRLKLDRESQLMKLLHSRTPVQKTRKGLQHMDHISQYEDRTLMQSV